LINREQYFAKDTERLCKFPSVKINLKFTFSRRIADITETKSGLFPRLNVKEKMKYWF
jgi:hypothetical protein